MNNINEPNLSVLIIVKNEPTIAHTLKVLRSQIEELNGECIVIDASGTALEKIKERNMWAKWVIFDQPIGFASTISMQRNLAVREASSNILLFCDAGSIPCETWVLDLYQALKQGSFDLVGGPLIFFHGEKSLGFRNFQKFGEEVDYPTCGNMGFTRSAYEATAGFNEKLLVAEDDDFAWQLKKQGILNACIPSAIMRMDLGNYRRRFVRSWRYGKGIVNLLQTHSDLRKIRFQKNPDVLLYPILISIYLGFLLGAIVKPTLLIMPIIISSFLIIRNMRSKTRIFDHLSHFVYASGSIVQSIKMILKRKPNALLVQYPKDDSAYLNRLSESLNSKYQTSIRFPDLTKSDSLNILLLPFVTPILRIFGIRLLNIHWIVGKWQPRWANNRLGRQLLWYWFKLWICSLKFFHFKVVYTVHDLKFHSRVFNNDDKAQKYLIEKADALVFLNELSQKIILNSWPKKPLALIPEGPIEIISSISRSEMRKKLDVAETKILLVLVGRLEPYKGVDLLFPAANIMPKNLAIRIAGVCKGEYQVELERLAARAQEIGLDIELDARGLSDEEFSGYLNCADYFIYPCRDINNSGSINAALTANVPVIVPDMPELDWVLPESKVVMRKTSEAKIDFKECFDRISNMTPITYQDLKKGTMLWKSERSWEKVSDRYIKLYRDLLND